MLMLLLLCLITLSLLPLSAGGLYARCLRHAFTRCYADADDAAMLSATRGHGFFASRHTAAARHAAHAAALFRFFALR